MLHTASKIDILFMFLKEIALRRPNNCETTKVLSNPRSIQSQQNLFKFILQNHINQNDFAFYSRVRNSEIPILYVLFPLPIPPKEILLRNLDLQCHESQNVLT